MSSPDSGAALAYHEPPVEVILTQASFMILLNLANWALDRLVYCGLVGQILVGIAWGTPGLQLLSTEAENVFVQLGYIGLILLVFEGGLSTSIPSLRANFARSVGVAVTGISAPIALSFVLAPLTGASHLQCFAAGAALCSTSLGTTFTVLRACGLSSTRLGVVLTCAAMLDDVVGLVMVQVISNLGGGDAAATPVSALTVVRPIFVSVGFAVVSILACRLVVQPARMALHRFVLAHPDARLSKTLCRCETGLVFCSVLLIGLVTAASYAGTSNLFAAYIAGAVISWWDSSAVPLPARSGKATAAEPSQSIVAGSGQEDNLSPALLNQPQQQQDIQAAPPEGVSSGLDIFQHYYHPALKWVLQPFFFASIGFSIPITRMFTGPVIWRGVVYAVLMAVAKLLCGIWLVRLPSLGSFRARVKNKKPTVGSQASTPSSSVTADQLAQRQENGEATPSVDNQAIPDNGEAVSSAPSSSVSPQTKTESKSTPGQQRTGTQPPSTESQNATPIAPAPVSLYPGAILGLAMIPRGEIGFLISAVAQSNDIFTSSSASSDSDIFLIVTWAIVLCTVVGPLSVGLLVRRIKRLSNSKGKDASSRDVLGVWGI